MEVDAKVGSAVRRVTDRFLRLGQSTPMHEIKASLGPKRKVLNDLLTNGFLRTVGDSYFPGLLAVSKLENPERRVWCLRGTAAVHHALKELYTLHGERTFDTAKVLDLVRNSSDPLITEDDVRAGMLFATEFHGYISGWSNDPSGAVASARVTEGILDFDGIQPAWHRELQARKAAIEAAKGTRVDGPPIEDPADVDALLGIYNRGRFDNDLRRLLASATNEAPLSLAMIDVDHFKEVNDNEGHEAGDRVLKNVPSILKTASRGKGFCYRWGGDEIALLLPNYSVSEAQAVAERVGTAVDRARLGVPERRVTVSVGVATFPETTDDPQQLFAHADKAMYAAKDDGGNQVRKADKKSPLDSLRAATSPTPEPRH